MRKSGAAQCQTLAALQCVFLFYFLQSLVTSFRGRSLFRLVEGETAAASEINQTVQGGVQYNLANREEEKRQGLEEEKSAMQP